MFSDWKGVVPSSQLEKLALLPGTQVAAPYASPSRPHAIFTQLRFVIGADTAAIRLMLVLMMNVRVVRMGVPHRLMHVRV